MQACDGKTVVKLLKPTTSMEQMFGVLSVAFRLLQCSRRDDKAKLPRQAADVAVAIFSKQADDEDDSKSTEHGSRQAYDSDDNSESTESGENSNEDLSDCSEPAAGSDDEPESPIADDEQIPNANHGPFGASIDLCSNYAVPSGLEGLEKLKSDDWKMEKDDLSTSMSNSVAAATSGDDAKAPSQDIRSNHSRLRQTIQLLNQSFEKEDSRAKHSVFEPHMSVNRGASIAQSLPAAEEEPLRRIAEVPRVSKAPSDSVSAPSRRVSEKISESHVVVNSKSATKESMDSLSQNLIILSQMDDKNVLTVRKMNRFGEDAKPVLNAYFSAFGTVEHVLVSVSRQAKGPGKSSRLRMTSVGFVVMNSSKDAEAVLAFGAEHVVQGLSIFVSGYSHRDAEKEEFE
jgi:hypothetical protein